MPPGPAIAAPTTACPPARCQRTFPSPFNVGAWHLPACPPACLPAYLPVRFLLTPCPRLPACCLPACLQVLEQKGLDIVRRDWCPLCKDVGNYALRAILSGQGREEVVGSIHEHLADVKEKVGGTGGNAGLGQGRRVAVREEEAARGRGWRWEGGWRGGGLCGREERGCGWEEGWGVGRAGRGPCQGADHERLADTPACCAVPPGVPQVLAGQVPLNKYIITKQLTKRPDDYPDAKNQPHVQVGGWVVVEGWCVSGVWRWGQCGLLGGRRVGQPHVQVGAGARVGTKGGVGGVGGACADARKLPHGNEACVCGCGVGGGCAEQRRGCVSMCDVCGGGRAGCCRLVPACCACCASRRGCGPVCQMFGGGAGAA